MKNYKCIAKHRGIAIFEESGVYYVEEHTEPFLTYRAAHEFINDLIGRRENPERNFKIGDYVNWTNSDGFNLGKRKVIGLDSMSGDTYFDYRCFIEPIDTPWYSISESNLELYDPAIHG